MGVPHSTSPRHYYYIDYYCYYYYYYNIDTMAPCPRYVKSVTVTAHDTDITVSAHYTGHKGEYTVETVSLVVGESHTFPEKIEDMGSWTAVCMIHTLRGTAGEESFVKTCEEDCGGIEKHIGYTVHKGGQLR